MLVKHQQRKRSWQVEKLEVEDLDTLETDWEQKGSESELQFYSLLADDLSCLIKPRFHNW